MQIRYSILLLLISVTVSIGMTSVIGIGIIQNDVVDIVEHEIPKIQYALEMEVYINEMAQDVLENLAQLPRDNTFADDAEKFRFFHDQYTALELTDHEKELMVQLDAKFEQFVLLGNELIEIEKLEIIEIQQEHADKVLELEKMKLLDYEKFHMLLKEMDDILDKELQTEAVEKISEEEHEVLVTIQEFFIVLFVVVSTTLVIGYIITKRLADRLSRLVKFTYEVEKGNYESRTDDIGNDEIGYLGRALNQSIIQLQQVTKEKTNSLFKKFHQMDTSHTRSHGGSGLGLVICKGYIEDMKGEIGLESDKGKGATFFFTIPKVED